MGVIDKSGAFLKYKGEVIAQGREAAKAVLGENHKLTKDIETEIWQRIKTQSPTKNLSVGGDSEPSEETII